MPTLHKHEPQTHIEYLYDLQNPLSEVRKELDDIIMTTAMIKADIIEERIINTIRFQLETLIKEIQELQKKIANEADEQTAKMQEAMAKEKENAILKELMDNFVTKITALEETKLQLTTLFQTITKEYTSQLDARLDNLPELQAMNEKDKTTTKKAIIKLIPTPRLTYEILSGKKEIKETKESYNDFMNLWFIYAENALQHLPLIANRHFIQRAFDTEGTLFKNVVNTCLMHFHTEQALEELTNVKNNINKKILSFENNFLPGFNKR